MMVMPPMQSICGDNHGTYKWYMSPFMAGMLSLPCQQMFGASAAEVWWLVISSHNSGGPGDGTFASLAIPHLLKTGFLRSEVTILCWQHPLKVSRTCLTIHYNITKAVISLAWTQIHKFTKDHWGTVPIGWCLLCIGFLLVNTQIHKFTKDHCRTVPIRWCLLCICCFLVVLLAHFFPSTFGFCSSAMIDRAPIDYPSHF